MKMAAMEAMWDTQQAPASLTLMGWPSQNSVTETVTTQNAGTTCRHSFALRHGADGNP